MIKKVKKHIWLQYLLTGIQLYTLIFFGFECIPQKVLNTIKDKSITHNIFRIHDNDSFMCRLCCITFVKYMLAGKTLLSYTNLTSSNDFKRNDKIIYK